MNLRNLFRRRDPVEIDLRSCIGLKDPVDWIQRAKLDKRVRYALLRRELEVARGRAALEA